MINPVPVFISVDKEDFIGRCFCLPVFMHSGKYRIIKYYPYAECKPNKLLLKADKRSGKGVYFTQ